MWCWSRGDSVNLGEADYGTNFITPCYPFGVQRILRATPLAAGPCAADFLEFGCALLAFGWRAGWPACWFCSARLAGSAGILAFGYLTGFAIF